MFEWLKVLNRISKEENYMEKCEARLSDLKSTAERLEKRCEQYAELAGKTEAELKCGKENLDKLVRELQKISSEAENKIGEIKTTAEKTSAALNEALKDCSKLAEDKISEIGKQAEEYAASVNGQIAEYEKNFAGFNQKLDELKQAVADFQR